MPQFDLDSFLPYQLNVLADRISREFSSLYRATYGISVPEWRVVAHLSRDGKVSVREIHQKVNMDKSRVSRAAARLEESGYIRKTQNTHDRRLVTLELTQKGRNMVDDIAPQAGKFEAEVLEKLGKDAPLFREAILTLLNRGE